MKCKFCGKNFDGNETLKRMAMKICYIKGIKHVPVCRECLYWEYRRLMALGG